jgi:hypothetical protein
MVSVSIRHSRDGIGTSDQPVYLIDFLSFFLYKHCKFPLSLNSIAQRVHKELLQADRINYHYPEAESVSIEISNQPV